MYGCLAFGALELLQLAAHDTHEPTTRVVRIRRTRHVDSHRRAIAMELDPRARIPRVAPDKDLEAVRRRRRALIGLQPRRQRH